MIRANLLRSPVLPAPEVVQTARQVARSLFRNELAAPRSNRLLAAINIPAPTPELRNRLLGKAPLRFVASRAEVMPGKVWLETLECGHEVTAYQNFLWDEKSHLINLEPSAVRRRCQECKEIAKNEIPSVCGQDTRTPMQPQASAIRRSEQELPQNIAGKATDGNREGSGRTGPMRLEIGVSEAASRSGCKPRNDSLPPRKPVQGVTDPRKKRAV